MIGQPLTVIIPTERLEEEAFILNQIRSHVAKQPRSPSRSLVVVTIAGPVIAAAWAFSRGGRFGRCVDVGDDRPRLVGSRGVAWIVGE